MCFREWNRPIIIRLMVTIMVMVQCVSEDGISRLLHWSGRWHSKCQSWTGHQPRQGDKNLKKSRFLLDTSKLVQRCVAVGHVSESLLVYRYVGLLSSRKFLARPSASAVCNHIKSVAQDHWRSFPGCGRLSIVYCTI